MRYNQRRRLAMRKREVYDEMIETDEIMEMLRKDGDHFFSKERNGKVDIAAYLEQLMDQKKLTRKEMICRLNLEESYGRKIFGGQRIPTRKVLLQCAFIFSLDLKETQRLLEVGQKPRLYARIRYDAAIIHGIEKKMSLDEMNKFLEEIGEEPLL